MLRSEGRTPARKGSMSVGVDLMQPVTTRIAELSW